MSLADRIHLLSRLVAHGVVTTTEQAAKALRAMEPTEPVVGPEALAAPVPTSYCAVLGCVHLPVAGAPLCAVHEGDMKNGPVADKTPCLFAVHDKGVCHLPHGHREDHYFGAPALSPRQALGEALACVERAVTLVKKVCEPTPPDVFKAGNLLLDAEDKLRRAYEAAK